MIVARNPGSAKKASSYAERLRLDIAVIHGEGLYTKECEGEVDEIDGRYSPPNVSRKSRTMDVPVGVPAPPCKVSPPLTRKELQLPYTITYRYVKYKTIDTLFQLLVMLAVE